MASTKHQAQLAMDTALPFDANSEPYEFVAENLQKRARILDTSGMRGSRSRSSERTRAGTYEVAGSIRMHAAPGMLDNLLPRILGAAESADLFNLAEALPEFQVMVDRAAQVFTYTDCKISRATLRGSAGRLVELLIDVVGKTESVAAAGSFPALTVPADPPYVMQEGVLTLQSAARQFVDFELIIDNLLVSRFVNSTTATEIIPSDRIITFRCRNPFTTAETDLYQQALAGAAASLTLTNGGQSTLFSFAALQFPDRSPTADAGDEIPLFLEGVARTSGGIPELTVTHDSTA